LLGKILRKLVVVLLIALALACFMSVTFSQVEISIMLIPNKLHLSKTMISNANTKLLPKNPHIKESLIKILNVLVLTSDKVVSISLISAVITLFVVHHILVKLLVTHGLILVNAQSLELA